MAQSNNLIVKKRIIRLLVKLSDFESLQADKKAQQNLVAGILKVFSAEDGDSSDICLKLACVDYLKNFYNDYQFDVQAYAFMLP